MDRARRQLAEIADLVPAARDVAHRQARRGGGGGASGKPGSSLPIDLGATARLDAVQNALSGWVRVIAEERGICPEIHGGGRTGSAGMEGMGSGGRDDLRASARWLVGMCEWMRHRAEVDTFLTDVDASARALRGVVNGPRERKYLGPCGADQVAAFAEGLADTERCEGDVYGWPGAEKGTCRTCGANVLQAERRAWLDDEVRQYAYTASEIAAAYPIRRNTINQWASRGRLAAHDHNEQGRARYNLGDVLELAAGEAARREERRAARERAEMGA
ncbi:hypothetical protein [Actinoplanes teichomyceticus]|nr:hypothetical protein [Actinoplanes teichomyceticus]